jgi:L-ascorbate oxidase
MIPVIKAEDDTSSDTGDSNGDTIRNFELNISLTLLNPDCFNESYPMLVINNQFPGPALHVVKNDIVKIRVRNSIENNNNQLLSIHFYGIRQYGTTFSDGVASITQLPIAPGNEFIQEFQVLKQAGTYYYHAHVGV